MEKVIRLIDTLTSFIRGIRLNTKDETSYTELISDIREELKLAQERELELKNKVECLEHEKDFYKSAIDSINNPVFLKNEDAEFLFFNKAYKDYFGIDGGEYIGKTVLSLDYIPLCEREAYHQEDISLIKDINAISHEKCFELPNGNVTTALYWSTAFSVGEDGARGLIGEIVDISLQTSLKNELEENVHKLKNANNKIEEMVKLDCLTSLYNRRMLEEMDDKILSKIKDEHTPIAVLLADLDHFKGVNDNFGHSNGDCVLVGFSKLLQDLCRKDDVIIRYGGEEFLIIIFNCSKETAISIAQRIRLNTEKQLCLPNHGALTVSIGVTMFSSVDTVDSCLSRVDTALYKAKELGRNRVEFLM